MNINKITASKIKELRTKNGLTSEAVAQALQISKGSYSQLENGKVELTLTRIELLAEFFKVPLSEIIPSTSSFAQNNNGDNNSNHYNSNNDNTRNNTFNNFFADENNMDTLINVIKSAINHQDH